MLDVINTTKTKFTLSESKLLPIKDFVLGKKFELSIAIVGEKKIHNLNKKFRNKDYATDVLSFPLSKTEGEIFLNQKVATKKAPDFDMTPKDYFIFVLIHSMLHLKGYEHGEEMEKEEQKILKKFL
jgi:probable rRNA maturation factor